MIEDASLQERLSKMEKIIDQRAHNKFTYDDSVVRQMIECIQVHKDGKLTVIFGGGYEIEESILAENQSLST